MDPKDIKRVVVTGANCGLGFEACRQLIEKGVEKVILACRSEPKGHAAIDKLVKLTGKANADKFELCIMDTNDLTSCRKAAEAIPGEIDGVILNAGGFVYTNGSELHTSGATNIFCVTVLGHVCFVEGLMEQNKLTPRARVMYAGSEASRGVTLMMMKPVEFKGDTRADIQADMKRHINGEAFSHYKAEDAYAAAKTIATLWMSAMARKNNELVFVTVSPGGCFGAHACDEASMFMKVMNRVLGPTLFRLAGVMHSVTVGARRYMVGVGLGKSNEIKVETGGFYASPKGKMSGKLVPQGPLYPMYLSQDHQEAAYDAIHEFL